MITAPAIPVQGFPLKALLSVSEGGDGVDQQVNRAANIDYNVIAWP